MNKLTVKNNQQIVASPMNYIGGKAKLLTQMMPYFPAKIDNFYDIFAGGANVAVNINAQKVFINDINKYVIDIISFFKENEIDNILNTIYFYIEKYSLSKTNKEGFLRLRTDYNKDKNPIKLYTLICYSFNYQFRFNNNHDYNNPFGLERSHFSKVLEDKLIRFVSKLKEKDVTISCQSFDTFLKEQKFTQDSFLYFDPPYLITTGSYNDGNRGFKNWTVSQERLLLNTLDDLNQNKVKFALSNVLTHKGKTNEILLEFSKKYRVIELNKHYNNSSYNTSTGESKEILLLNY
ncbi:Dam family site-specific DNA-(adenine-N6)-methyltransferase [Acinetobacter boissieri]|uniref:Site-specific DNA-methyltransferase (adenine-specific) n=1 Tax=Acinetobacter boissieri TaxID=1219383 RepID=A0A1G6GXL7_9GAMM|nr:Dam family site-specific DNA-(adenine-N6)-methyltransferase [Acinetobacter boissieri]SDB86800.1 DNA adenine methylase/adenine-specific DNA-methyltransferase [Acinetobacter boissieri]